MDTNFLNIAKTSLIGNICFDSYESELALKFFTIGSITNAILTLKANGLSEGTDFKLID